MPRSAPFHVFTPQRDQPEDLEKILVKRHALLASAVEKMRESVLHPDKHRLLFIGPRGMGKSYLVSLIHYRLSKQKALTGKMRFAWLNEDQTSTTFLHLLSRIYRGLAGQYPTEFPADELDQIRGKEPADAREILGAALLHHLKQRTVVLFLENLDAILGAMSDVEQRTWRGFIQDHPQFAIVATAQGITADVSSKEKPFFGFFEIHHLDPLTVDEAAELLEKIAELNNDEPLAKFIISARGKARTRAIHHLSGGNPRLYLILSDFLTKDSLDNLVRLFEDTVDRQLTPYFQERMRWISPQQQEIVQFLCQRVHPANVKEIAEGIFSKQNTVSSQLKQLREKGYLVSKSRGKESLYELAEPLMRLSFQVKEMNNRQPLALIVDFMRVWYDRQDLENRLAAIAPGTWGRDYFEVALQKIETEGNAFRHSLMLQILENTDLEECPAHELDEMREMASEVDESRTWLRYGIACIRNKRVAESIEVFTRVVDSSGPSSPPWLAALGLRAASYVDAEQWGAAIVDTTEAINAADPKDWIVAIMLLQRAYALKERGEVADALADLTKAIEFPRIKARADFFARLMWERGDLYREMGESEKAVADFGEVIRSPKAGASELTNALAGRGALLLEEKGRSAKQGLADLSRVIESEEAPVDRVAYCLLRRGDYHYKKGKYLHACEDFTGILKKEGVGDLFKRYAHEFRGGCFYQMENYEKAVEDFSKVPLDPDCESAPRVLAVLADIYGRTGNYGAGMDSVLAFLEHPRSADLIGRSTSNIFLGRSIVQNAFGLRGDCSKWLPSMVRILFHLKDKAMIADLSSALVDHLDTLAESDLNALPLNRWVSDWEDVCRDHPEMQLGIRMLRAGVEWIKTKDESVLLDLVKEERAIVRQALGLEPEMDE